MQRTASLGLVLILLTAAVTAGCFGDDDTDGTTPTTPPADNETQPQVDLSLSVLNVTVGETVEGNVSVNVTWSVGVASDGASGNETTGNQTTGNETQVEITHNNIHWANRSVAEADAQAGYGNGSADVPGSVPGEFTTNFTVAAGLGILYVRAHAMYQGEHHWSAEANVTIPEAGTTHFVSITNEVLPFIAEMDPDPITVKVGDRIVWQNDDDAPHTATADADQDFSWDTGNLAAGDSSDPIVFDVAGEFTYHCEVHPATMTGFTVTVES